LWVIPETLFNSAGLRTLRTRITIVSGIASRAS
jgi:hypothetical protein